jgi:uncharacterized cupin superfamily protein
MSVAEQGYALLRPEEAFWRPSNIMKVPNTNLAEQLGATQLGARLWRLPPYSANTLHRHVTQEELYFVLEGTGRIRVGGQSLTVPRFGAVLVAPHVLRQPFNDTADEVLWLIVGAPRSEVVNDPKQLYPEDPKQLPLELRGRTWPPA